MNNSVCVSVLQVFLQTRQNKWLNLIPIMIWNAVPAVHKKELGMNET